MKRSWFFILVAALSLFFSVGLLKRPEPMMLMYGVKLHSGGMLLARLLGALLLANAVTFWMARNSPDSPAVSGLLAGGLIFNALEGFVAFRAERVGAMNSMGWGIFAVDAVLVIGFACYLFKKKTA